MSSIGFETLLAYAAGELDPGAAAEVRQFLEVSPEAAATVQRICTAISNMRSDDSVAPPADVVARARAIFAQLRQPRQRGWLRGLRQVLADLIYDSRLQPALAGFRSAQETVQVSYAAEDVSVDLHIEAASTAEGQHRIMGQVTLPYSGVRVRIQLATSDSQSPPMECVADEFGMFSLNTTAGRYDMAVCTDDWAMIIPDLQVA